MKSLQVKSFGPIVEGSIAFGDLTVFVGPQASGKSLLVQLIKAVADSGCIRNTLKQFGFDWLHGDDPTADFLSIYFGGGMSSVWSNRTEMVVDGKPVDFLKQVVSPPGRISRNESVFLIPAQRVLALQDGWPKPFMGYSTGDPFCLRNFSDSLRKLMEQGLGSGKAIFPQSRRLKSEVRRLIDEGIYVAGTLTLHTDGMRKQIVLQPNQSKEVLPYNAWSAGQREFTPLLLGLYWLMPSSKISKRDNITTVIIEEPEMGLHPRAIHSFCLTLFELLQRQYRVIVSTHSPVILDIVWMMQELKSVPARDALSALRKAFMIRRMEKPIREVFENALKLNYKTYYFNRESSGVKIEDISSLDPGDENTNISGWGGLSEFSGTIADIVCDSLHSTS